MTTYEIMGLIRELCEEVRDCARNDTPPSPLASVLRERIRVALFAALGR
jgi:hypothetical protein